MAVECRSPEVGVTGRCQSPDMVLGTNIQCTTKVASNISYSAISPAPKNSNKSFKTKVLVSFLHKSQALKFIVCHCYWTGILRKDNNFNVLEKDVEMKYSGVSFRE